MNLRILLCAALLLILRPAYAQQPTPAQPPATDAAKPRAAAEPSSATAKPNPPASPALSPFDGALALYNKGQFAVALLAFQSLAQANGDDAAKSYAWLARTDLRLSKVPEAEQAARKSLDLVPNLPTGHSALGEVYFRQGKFADAEREFLTPLRAGVPDSRAFWGEARLSRASSNYKHAKSLIDKAHALDPHDREIERDWFATLTRAERIKVLQARLNSSDPLDPTDKKRTEDHLAFLQGQESRPAAPCHLATTVTSTELPLERLMLDATKLRGYGLNVKVNGTSSKLMLDTGASGILVNSRIAEHAGVKKIADLGVEGIGNQGAASGYVAYADSIQIGALEFQGCLIRVVDRKRSLDEDGFIGSDVFDNYLVDINFPDEKFKLAELPKPPDVTEKPLGLVLESDAPRAFHDRYIAPEMQSYEKFYRFGHDILLPTLVNTTGNSRLFLVDTGSYSVNLSADLARQVTKVHNDEYTTVKGLSGNVKYVYRADSVKLAFGHFMHPAEDVVALDLSDLSNENGTEVSGILGFSLLWILDVKIDYRDGLIDFQYDPNRIH